MFSPFPFQVPGVYPKQLPFDNFEPRAPNMSWRLLMMLPVALTFCVIFWCIASDQPKHAIIFSASILTSAMLYFQTFTAIMPDKSAPNFSQLPMNSRLCNYVDIPYFTRNNRFHNHSSSTFILVFILAYFVTPMLIYNNHNYELIAALVIFVLVDGAYKLMFSCTGGIGLITGIVSGALCGGATFMLQNKMLDSDSAVFINKFVKNQTCSLDAVETQCDIED